MHSVGFCLLVACALTNVFYVQLIAFFSPWFGHGIRVTLHMSVITLLSLQKGIGMCLWPLLDEELRVLDGHLFAVVPPFAYTFSFNS